MADEKIVIKNVDQLISAVVNYVNDKQSLTKDLYEEMAKERYETGRDLRHYMITDFATEKFVGDNDDVIEMYKLGTRLNEMALNSKDPVMIAAMLSMSKNGTEFFADTVRNKLAPTYIGFLNDFIKDNPQYDVPEKYKNEFIELDKAAGRKMAVSDDITPDQAFNMGFDQCPLSIKESVVTNAMSVFFDRNALNNDNGVRQPISAAMKDFWYEAITGASAILNAGFGTGKFVPQNEEQKELFEHLKLQCKGMSSAQKETMRTNLSQLTIEDMIDNDRFALAPESVSLKFESNYVLNDLTVESFIQKNESRGLSYAEAEWGEASFDRMLDLIYTADELKRVKKLGFDPCTEVYIDGKSVLDLPTGETKDIDGVEMLVTYRQKFEEAKPTKLDYAKLKCDICAAALSGKKLDICKIKENPDVEGGIAVSEPTTVKTNVEDMKKEPVSLWTRILRFFGILKDPDKQIEKSSEMSEHEKDHKQILEKIGFNELIGVGTVQGKSHPPKKTMKTAEKTAEKTSELN